jgi:hypothetical protein
MSDNDHDAFSDVINELKCSALASEVQYALMNSPFGVNNVITEFLSTHLPEIVIDLTRFSEVFSYGVQALSEAVKATKKHIKESGDNNVATVFYNNLSKSTKVKAGSHENALNHAMARHYIAPALNTAFEYFFCSREFYTEESHPARLKAVSLPAADNEYLELFPPSMRGDITIIKSIHFSYGFENTLYGLCIVLLYARKMLSQTVFITAQVFESLYGKPHPKSARWWGDTTSCRDLFAKAMGFEKVEGMDLFRVNPEPYPTPRC